MLKAQPFTFFVTLAIVFIAVHIFKLVHEQLHMHGQPDAEEIIEGAMNTLMLDTGKQVDIMHFK
ncbi:hypothetical protein EWM64_g6183 [Hericium alpestre]|uniref:Uncharacterized protein n=1 Tax=Hericium alpestre TaxID=135208 RepID=A0A4Y9ZWF0_9AGAM|nr:hypothetical protein EWM64_g6183 [Hericium alpestre]